MSKEIDIESPESFGAFLFLQTRNAGKSRLIPSLWERKGKAKIKRLDLTALVNTQ